MEIQKGIRLNMKLARILSAIILIELLLWLGFSKIWPRVFGGGLVSNTQTLEYTTTTPTPTISPVQVDPEFASTFPPTYTLIPSSTTIPTVLYPTASATFTIHFTLPTNTPVPGNPGSKPKPTQAPPTSVPPTSVPPTAVPPTAVPPTAVPPTPAPPTPAPPIPAP
jgi:hypothetical protein